MNSRNSKTSDFQRLLVNLSDKIKSKRSDNYVVLSNRSSYIAWKNTTKSRKNKNIKTAATTWK